MGPWSYRLVHHVFRFVSSLFYHTIECHGRQNVPKPQQATILAPNHGNSLTDAVRFRCSLASIFAL